MRILLATLLVLQALVLAAPLAAAQDAACGPDARAVGDALRSDYAGRDLLLDADRAAALDAVLAQADAMPDAAACDSLLWTATALFPDGHLDVQSQRAMPSRFFPDRRYGPFGGDLGLRFVGDSSAVLRLPSFGMDFKPAIDSLIAANRERLLQTPHLVIDLRGNGGGGDAAFEEVLPFLYTRPIRMGGAEIIATPGTRAYYAGYLGDPRFDEETQTWLREIVAALDAVEPGSFAPMAEDGAFDVVLDGPTAMPRAVAVLVDGGVGSAAEELTLMARTSHKVVVVGTATHGSLDYSNVRDLELPSGERVMRVPTTRRTWLPAFSVDAGGIRPDVVIPDGVADWPAFALGVLAAREAAGAPQQPFGERAASVDGRQ